MKVLIIRFSSIGDIVLTSPVIRCIKLQLGDVDLHYLTKSSFENIVANNPYISKIHTLKNSLTDLINQLQKEEFDLIIDLHKSLRSRAIVRRLNVESLTFEKLNIKKFLFTQFKINSLPKIHLVDRYFNGISSLNVKYDKQGLDYFIPEKCQLSTELAQLINDPYIVFAIGGTYSTKRLPLDKMIELVDKLKLPVILIGGKDDMATAEELTEKSSSKSIYNYVGKLSVDESALLIKNSNRLITHDTGMMHIAAAFKKPISVIWGNTHPSLGMYPFGYSDNQKISNHEVELKCRPCSKLGYNKCPKGHFNCMNLQNVDEIVKNCHSIEHIQ